jgi:hypothetical protein
VSAGFSKPKKKLVDGQKRKMSEPIIGMSGSPYHLGSMIVSPSDVLVFTPRDFLFPRRNIMQFSTGTPASEASAMPNSQKRSSYCGRDCS